MIKMLTAHTLEIDDADAAVAEVLAQLDTDDNLLAHSAGIITCYAEFIASGVVAALAEALPFDLVGTTTIGCAVPGARDQLMLSLSVLTSDDIQFAAGMSDSLEADANEKLGALYKNLAAKLPGPPALMFAFAPLIFSLGGDQVIEYLNEASGGVPYFGATAVDHNDDYHEAQTLFGGEASRTGLSLLLLSGEVDPLFMVANISDEKVQKQKAVITASAGNQLEKVNDMPVRDYISTLGLNIQDSVGGMNTIPFVIDFNDGTKPVTRSIFAITPDGFAVGGGAMPVNATLSIGAVDYDDIIATTGSTMEAIIKSHKKNGVLLFSCVGRNLNLGTDTYAEMDKVAELLGDGLPYQFSYVGGEMCPVYTADGSPVNRFHNVTLIACAL